MEKRKGGKHGGIIENFRRNYFVTSVKKIVGGTLWCFFNFGYRKMSDIREGGPKLSVKIFLFGGKKSRREKIS